MDIIKEYLKVMQDIQFAILEFLESEDNTEENYQNLINIISNHNILDNLHKFKSFLILLDRISNNHYHKHDFFDKIYRLIQFFKKKITYFFSNFEIYTIFQKNKRILLFLIQEKILKIDKKVAKKIINHKNQQWKFFYPEIRFFHSIDFQIAENFDEKRKIGENDDILCNLIRNDSIEEFIIFVKKNVISLKSSIKPSIFETNPFLLKNKPSLIEYAAFFGSIQIFKYLFMNGADKTSSLWLYAIHSQHAELFYILNENNIEPQAKSYEMCIKEAIKCHHNDVVNYIQNNYMQNEEFNFFDDNTIFKYYNFAFIKTSYINEDTLFDLCKYGYYILVNSLLKDDEININECII